MRSLNSLALFVGFASIAGCSDNSSLNGVYPKSGFLGRTVRVEVSGDNVSFKEGAKVDFGPGTTVSNVTVASKTSLIADVQITDAAAVGPHDVVVQSDGNDWTLTQAFDVASPLKTQFQGKLAQGSVVMFSLRNLDFTAPFDTTCGASFFGMCLQYTNMQVVTPEGVFGSVSSVDDYVVTGALFIDTDAAGGDFKLVSGPMDKVDEQIVSPLGKTLDIAARSATALSQAPTTTTVAEAYDSALFSADGAGTSVSRFLLTTNNQDASPNLYILPETGHFLDMITSGPQPNALMESPGKLYAIYFDQAGAFGYSYGLKVNSMPLQSITEAASNDTYQTAQVAPTAQAFFGGASLSSGTDQDWIRIPVATGDSNKVVHVVTAGHDPFTDTVVEIYKNTGDPANMIGASDDSAYLDEAVTDNPIGAGVTAIYVKIYASQFFDPKHTSYIAGVWLE